MIMPPSLVAPFHEDSYNEHFYKNGPFRLHGDHPGPPAAFRKVLELFAGKWGLSFGYLIIRMNDNVQCGFIGQRTKRETRDWRHDEVAVMLMFHDFPRCGAELYADVELNNRAILNGIARLYMMTDLDLEAWLSLCAEDSGLDLGGPQEDQYVWLGDYWACEARPDPRLFGYSPRAPAAVGVGHGYMKVKEEVASVLMERSERFRWE